MTPVPPSAAIRLVLDGHTVARVIEWTGCNRWHIERTLQRCGYLIDPNTDLAHEPEPDVEQTPWRAWARDNGWPSLGDAGRLPEGLMDAYIAANPHDLAAVRFHRRALRRNRRTA